MRMYVLEDDKHVRNVKNKKKRLLQFGMIACLPPYLAHYTGPKPLGDSNNKHCRIQPIWWYLYDKYRLIDLWNLEHEIKVILHDVEKNIVQLRLI